MRMRWLNCEDLPSLAVRNKNSFSADPVGLPLRIRECCYYGTLERHLLLTRPYSKWKRNLLVSHRSLCLLRGGLYAAAKNPLEWENLTNLNFYYSAFMHQFKHNNTFGNISVSWRPSFDRPSSLAPLFRDVAHPFNRYDGKNGDPETKFVLPLSRHRQDKQNYNL